MTTIAAPMLLLFQSYLLGQSGWLLGNFEVIIITCLLSWLFSFLTALLFGMPIRALWLGVFFAAVRRGISDRFGACLASTAASIFAAYAGLSVVLFVGSILESDPSSSAPSLFRFNKVAIMIFAPVAVTAVVTSWIVFPSQQKTGGAV